MLSPEEIIITVWFFVIGGVIGSFLNVVVYRLPRKISLIEPPSHCPKCKNRIRWRYNVPVFGWLMLRGKCRDCGQPISPRYPLVELTTAIMFGAVMVVEFVLQGVNLPPRNLPGEGETFTVNVISSDKFFLIAIYHLLLLTVLLVGWLIEFDRERPPARMYFWAMLMGLVFPLQWTALRPMKAWPDEPAFFAGGIESLAGLALGAAVAFLVWKIERTRQAGGLPWGLVCVGAFLGWQAVLPIAAAAAILGTATALILPKNPDREWTLPASAWLWLLTFCWIMFWSPLVSLLNLT
jgi:leader peptidase (prepilin peptidase)/N-methyltransferase